MLGVPRTQIFGDHGKISEVLTNLKIPQCGMRVYLVVRASDLALLFDIRWRLPHVSGVSAAVGSLNGATFLPPLRGCVLPVGGMYASRAAAPTGRLRPVAIVWIHSAACMSSRSLWSLPDAALRHRPCLPSTTALPGTSPALRAVRPTRKDPRAPSVHFLVLCPPQRVRPTFYILQ